MDPAKGVVGDALAKHPDSERAIIKEIFTVRIKTEIPPTWRHFGRGTIAAVAHLIALDCSVCARWLLQNLLSNDCVLKLKNIGKCLRRHVHRGM